MIVIHYIPIAEARHSESNLSQ